VDADANRTVGERLPRLLGGGGRLVSASECKEAGIALRVDLDAAVAAKRSAECPPVFGKRLAIALAVLLQQPRRPLDVGEEKGDRAGGKFRHA